jgi:hypothetical protein
MFDADPAAYLRAIAPINAINGTKTVVSVAEKSATTIPTTAVTFWRRPLGANITKRPSTHKTGL